MQYSAHALTPKSLNKINCELFVLMIIEDRVNVSIAAKG